jgi:hypothetical protein
MSQARWLSQPQSHRLASNANTSCNRFKMRSATDKTSQADFGSWGMSWMGSMPRSAKALEIPTTRCDNRITSVAHSLVIPSVSAQA